ncbi:MAG TPA: hypothetical protein VEU33_41300, partial [Archangium sp.]|nr:hypothetical protein [Archangium sp.]
MLIGVFRSGSLTNPYNESSWSKAYSRPKKPNVPKDETGVLRMKKSPPRTGVAAGSGKREGL